MAKRSNVVPLAAVKPVQFGQALQERYLSYALSTITQRALPDARDGLKPVHRRILHGMRLLRLDPDGAYKKSAKVVGDVMGSFHPHGDQSIYDALVRLAQDFSMRYPLADGQGNFGNIDGDSAAAMRYTECKLTPAAVLLLDGIDQDAVDFRPTYDDQDEEPIVLPAGFPFLTFFPAVIICGFVFGLRQGVLVAILSGLSAWYFFISPGRFDFSMGTLLAMGLYLFVVTTELTMIYLVTRAYRQEIDTREEIQRLAEQQFLDRQLLLLARERARDLGHLKDGVGQEAR